MIRRIGQCSARGPYRDQCTHLAGHLYAHYDACTDRSWTDHTEDHRDGCECDVCQPEIYDGGEQHE